MVWQDLLHIFQCHCVCKDIYCKCQPCSFQSGQPDGWLPDSGQMYYWECAQLPGRRFRVMGMSKTIVIAEIWSTFRDSDGTGCPIRTHRLRL
eukprot:2879631-Rhodomonas_salina.2